MNVKKMKFMIGGKWQLHETLNKIKKSNKEVLATKEIYKRICNNTGDVQYKDKSIYKNY